MASCPRGAHVAPRIFRAPLAVVLSYAAWIPFAAAQSVPASPLAGAAPPPVYRSAFDGYRPYADNAPTDWRGANDAVHAVGGHSGALRERDIAKPAASAPVPAPAPAPAAHPVTPVQTSPMPGHGH